MSIRVRLALGGVAVAGLTLVLFGVGLERLVALTAPRNQDRDLSALARRAVVSIDRAAPASLASGLPPVAGDAATSTDAFTAILDDRGRLLYSSARLDGAERALPAAVVREAKRRGAANATVPTRSGVALRVQVQPWRRGDLGRSGLVLVGQPRRVAAKQVSDFRGFLLVSGIVALVVAALATWVVSGRALRPLRRLAAAADEIGRTGDVERRLHSKRSKDVAGVLTGSFNAMLDRLAAAQRRLEEALEAQRQFVADASHELRNPLATIRSNAGFLIERPEASAADRADALADIAAEGERVARLVDDLLALARADTGQPLERRPVELAPVVRDVAHQARHAGRPIRLDLDPAVVALGDPDALRRLVAILLDNALRHGAGEVELRVAADDGHATLRACDRGQGIAERDMERIFDRFYRADQARPKGGAGLGLAIALSVVNGHGGSIRAESRPGGGAIFTVRLPLAHGAA